MSDQENTDPLKDLEMAFLPQWAQEPNDAKPYADFSGDDRPRGRGPVSYTHLTLPTN